MADGVRFVPTVSESMADPEALSDEGLANAYMHSVARSYHLVTAALLAKEQGAACHVLEFGQMYRQAENRAVNQAIELQWRGWDVEDIEQYDPEPTVPGWEE